MQNPFSIFEAAASCPDQIGLRRAGEDYSFSRLATLTQNTIDRLRREKALPVAGRPMIIEGKKQRLKYHRAFIRFDGIKYSGADVAPETYRR